MPALVLCNRRWLLAGDDIIFPFFIETIVRIIWFPAISVILFLHLQNDQNHIEAKYVTYILSTCLVDFVFNLLLCGTIIWSSSRGSVMQADKRHCLLKLLYIKVVSFVFEILICIAVTWFIFSSRNLSTWVKSDVKVFLEISCIFSWGYFLSWIVLAAFAYDPTGSAKFWKDHQLEMNNSAKYFKKSTGMWKRRLQFLCCCLGVNKANNSIYKEIASFLAAFFKDINLVPSDTLAGLAILSKKHAAERRRLKFLDSLHNQEYASPNEITIPSWMSVENALYFLQLAKSTYRWPIFFDSCNPCNLCALASCLKCCNSSNTRKAEAWQYHTAVLGKITRLSSDDIIYVNYRNAIYEPAFFIAIDRQKCCVVICIRGTLSVSDIVTDIDGESESVDTCSVKFQCHRGTLKSAMYIYDKLAELKTLKSVFSEFPNFYLAITGHSLGGSIAAVLSIMLGAEYPDLQCYTFGPLAVLSGPGAKQTYDHVFTVIVGDDMSPRLCVRSCVDLRSDVVKCLTESKMQKYKLFLGACSRFLLNIKLFRTEDEIGKRNNFHEILENNISAEHPIGSFSSAERLYAPGRILHLEYDVNGIRSSWKTGFNFQRLIITPRMIRDHQPRKIQKMLGSVKIQQKEQSPLPFFNRSLSIPEDFYQKAPDTV